jgi:uncharacterized membrane protein
MTMTTDLTEHEQTLRDQALDRIKKKREFGAHLVAYLLFNGFLVVIWAVTGAHFFWPVFPILGWGIGLVFHAMDAYARPVPTEERIRREMEAIERDER